MLNKSPTVAGKGTGANKPLDQAALEVQYGKGNVTQGGGNTLATKENVTGNIAESQKGTASSNFGQQVSKEQEVNANLGKRPEDQIWTETNKNHTKTELSGGSVEYRLQDGRGIRYNADGSFSGFLDPKRNN